MMIAASESLAAFVKSIVVACWALWSLIVGYAPVPVSIDATRSWGSAVTLWQTTTASK